MQVAINSVEEAVALVRRMDGELPEDQEPLSVRLGEWVNLHVHLDMGLHSEITPPFMEAFVEIQQSIYRLVGQIKYGVADIRRLTQDDLDTYQIRVKVLEGSSDIWGEITEPLNNLVRAAADKMSGSQILGLIGGLAVLASGYFGYGTYLEHRKEERIAQVQSDERKQALQIVDYARRDQVETTREVIGLLKAQGGAPAKAVETAASVHGALLKAASQTPQAVIGGQHLNRPEAKELRASQRRQAQRMIVEREMRVVDVNTSDPLHTTVIIEDPEGGAQHRVAFADRLIQDRDTGKLYDSLRTRAPVWLRLDIKEVGGEMRVVDIVRVVDAPPHLVAPEVVAER